MQIENCGIQELRRREREIAIECVCLKDVGCTPEANRFFELRGLYNRGRVGLCAVENALSVARRVKAEGRAQ